LGPHQFVPGAPRSIPVLLLDTIGGGRLPAAHDVPQIASHVLFIDERRYRSDLFRPDSESDCFPGLLLENGHRVASGVTRWRIAFCPGFANTRLNSGVAWMNLMRARFARAASGIFSRGTDPLSTFRNSDFKAAS